MPIGHQCSWQKPFLLLQRPQKDQDRPECFVRRELLRELSGFVSFLRAALTLQPTTPRQDLRAPGWEVLVWDRAAGATGTKATRDTCFVLSELPCTPVTHVMLHADVKRNSTSRSLKTPFVKETPPPPRKLDCACAPPTRSLPPPRLAGGAVRRAKLRMYYTSQRGGGSPKDQHP